MRFTRALQDIVDAKGKFESMFVGDVTVRVYGEAAVARGTDTWDDRRLEGRGHLDGHVDPPEREVADRGGAGHSDVTILTC